MVSIVKSATLSKRRAESLLLLNCRTAELLLALPNINPSERDVLQNENQPFQQKHDLEDRASYLLAKRCFDCKELKECARVLELSTDVKARWLRLYARYLARLTIL